MNHNLTLITLALLAVGAASQAERAKNKERADARPEQPVAAAALAPEQYAAFKKPVVARVVPEIISRPVGPMSFVSGTSRDLNLVI
jgi:hypothetical protein